MNLILIICTLLNAVIYSKCETFDVTKYGADITEKIKSSDAVKKAIDGAVSKGGGTVYFPKGEYLSGPIHLKSNIILNLDENAVIKFSNDLEDYLPMVTSRWEGTELKNFSPLIYAYNQTNLGITGKGTLDGQGAYWCAYRANLTKSYPKRDDKYQKEFLRLNNLTEIAKETADINILIRHFLDHLLFNRLNQRILL